MRYIDIQKPNNKRLTIRLPEEQLKLLSSMAKKNNATVPAALRAIIRDFFKTKGDK